MTLNLKGGIAFKQYKNSILKEVVRKSIHICASLVPLLLSYSEKLTVVLLSTALFCYCLSEILRLHGINLPFIAKLTAVAARKRDENKFVLGPVTLVIGILLAIFLWNPIATKIGIFALAFGDGFASLGGKFFGSMHIPFTGGKTVAGSLTCFLAVYISSFCVSADAKTALILATATMILEALPLADLDNIAIPVIIGGLAGLLG